MFKRRWMLIYLIRRILLLQPLSCIILFVLLVIFAFSAILHVQLKNIYLHLKQTSYNCSKIDLERWKEIIVPGQIRTVRPKNAGTTSGTSELKIILLWTKYFSEEFSNDYYFFQSGQQTFKQYSCEYSDCFITSNRSLFKSADAVLFHARDLKFSKLPRRPSMEQIWILYSLEPPRYMVLRWNYIQSMFNWTMTYRSDSDIQVKYGEIFRKNHVCSPFSTTSYKKVSNKTKDAIWMVSNCRTESRREAYVRELKKYFNVDVYGKCSHKRKCEPSQSETCYKLLEDYKYYLSFENSICKDYVTEKFFNILQYDVVPIVLGGVDYASIAPKNSFIDATKFRDPKKLAEFLTEVSRNHTLYESYFEWKSHYSVHLHPWMCDFCKRLHEQSENNYVKPKNFWSWWIPEAECRRWSRRKGFKKLF